MARGGFFDSLIDTEGRYKNGATVEVFDVDTGTPSTIYEDDGTTSIPGGTFLTGYRDGFGEIVFTADNGQYDIKITDGARIIWLENITITDGADLIYSSDLATTTTAGIVEKATPGETAAGTPDKFPDAKEVKDLLDSQPYLQDDRTSIDFSTNTPTQDANYTLSTAQNSFSQIEMTDTGVVLTAAREVIIDDSSRIFSFINSTAQTLTVKTISGTGIPVDPNQTVNLYSDGTDVILSYEGNLYLESPTATTSGTSHDYTGIPSWVKEITVLFDSLSTNGTNNYLIQIGDSGGIETTGYVCNGGFYNTGGQAVNSYTSGFGIASSSAANSFNGELTLRLMDKSNNLWNCSGQLSAGASVFNISGNKSLSATLDRVRLTTVGGTDTFDAGSFNIMYK